MRKEFSVKYNEKSNELEQLSNELASSKKREAIQIKVKEATKKEWYPGYSTGGKVGAFLVDFVLVIPPIMNLLGWILSGFGFAKNFRTIMQEKAGNDYEQQLMSEIDNEPEIYDVSTQKNSSSYQKLHNKNVISFDNDVEQNIVNGAVNNNDKFNISKAMANNSPIIKKVQTDGAVDEQNKTNANNDEDTNSEDSYTIN